MATDSLASTAPTHDTPPATKCVKGFEPSQQPATAAAVPQLPVRNNPPMIVPATICAVGTVLHDLDLRVQDLESQLLTGIELGRDRMATYCHESLTGRVHYGIQHFVFPSIDTGRFISFASQTWATWARTSSVPLVYLLLMTCTAHKPITTPAPQSNHCDHMPVTTVMTKQVAPVARMMPMIPDSPGISLRMLLLFR